MDLQPRGDDVASRLPLPLPFQEDGGQVAKLVAERETHHAVREDALYAALVYRTGEELCKEEQVLCIFGMTGAERLQERPRLGEGARAQQRIDEHLFDAVGSELFQVWLLSAARRSAIAARVPALSAISRRARRKSASE